MAAAKKKGVFISWSGKRSLHVAFAFRDLLGMLVPKAVPFVSDRDIEAGDSWDDAIRKNAKAAAFCIVCITANNRGSQWLHYEAGAMKEGFSIPVAPYLLGVGAGEVTGPLQRLQAKVADRSGTWDIVLSAAKRIDSTVDTHRLNELFDKAWDQFSKNLENAPDDVRAASGGDPAATPQGTEVYSDETVVHLLQEKLGYIGNSATLIFSDLEKELRLPAGSAGRNFEKAASERFTIDMASQSARIQRKPRTIPRMTVRDPRGWGGGF